MTTSSVFDSRKKKLTIPQGLSVAVDRRTYESFGKRKKDKTTK